MEKIEVKDKIDFICDKNFSSVIKKNEKLYWSGNTVKINRRGARQNRVFLITNDRLINVGKRGNFLTNIFSKLIKREISIILVDAITYSSISNNFVLHVPKEYDYYLCTSDKDEVIDLILKIQELKGKKDLKLSLVVRHTRQKDCLAK